MYFLRSLQHVPANVWSSVCRNTAYKTEKLYQIEASPLQKVDTITSIKIIFPNNGILK
jgi:hypothetical protein